MQHEDLVVSHMRHAAYEAVRFCQRYPDYSDKEEAISVAYLAMSKAAVEFRWSGEGDIGANFWGFARQCVFAALVDERRKLFGRHQTRSGVTLSDTRRTWVSLEEARLFYKRHRSEEKLMNRVTVERLLASRSITKRQRVVLRAVMMGYDNLSGGRFLQISQGRFGLLKRSGIDRLRKLVGA